MTQLAPPRSANSIRRSRTFSFPGIFASVILVVISISQMALAQEAAENAAPADQPPAVPPAAAPQDEFGPAYGFDQQPEYATPKTDLQYNLASGEKFAYEFEYESEMGTVVMGAKGTIIYRATSEDPVTLLPKERPDKQEGTGTAFVVRPDGFLMTCCHCVEGAIKVEVLLGDKTYNAKVIDLDPVNDLALIRIDAKNLTPLPIMDSDQIELGEEVRVVGYPLTNVLGESLKISRGTIAGINNHEGSKSFQLDAVVNPGNSGGPVVTEKGHVAGVAKALLSGDGISSLGLAVTSNDIRKMLARQNLNYRTANEMDDYLRGPDLARQVSPAVALIKVTVSTGGVGFTDDRILNYEAQYQPLIGKTDQSLRIPESIVVPESGKTLVNSFGEVNYCSSKVALPSLIGSIGMLGFETLPRENVQEWKDDRLMLVPRDKTRKLYVDFEALPRLAFQPERRAPFGFDSADPRRTMGALFMIPAAEACTYRIVGTRGNFVEIEKEHLISAVAKEGERPAFEVKGTAKIRFNKREGRIESIHYKGTAETTSDQLTIHFPIVYTLTRNDDLLNKKATPSQTAAATPTIPPRNQITEVPRGVPATPPSRARGSMPAPSFPTPSTPAPRTPRISKPAPTAKPIPKAQGLTKLRLD